MTEPEVIASNDIEAARIKRDLRGCDLRQRLVIEWRGDAYTLSFTDFDNEEPDTDWMWEELKTIVERRIPLPVLDDD